MQGTLDEMPLSSPRLLSGPAGFVPRTSWRPWSSFLVTTVITVAGIGVSAVAAALLVGVGARMNENLQTLWTLAFWQVATILLTLAAAAWGGRAADTLSLGMPVAGGVYVLALVILLSLQAIATSLELIFIPQEMFRDLRSFVDIARGPWWWLGFLVVGIGAPFAEELLFRGFLFSAIAKSRLGVMGAALISTTLWTALHAGYTVFGLIEIFAVGLLFSWLLWRTGSLRVTILCHAVYNCLIMLALRYLPLPSGLLPA